MSTDNQTTVQINFNKEVSNIRRILEEIDDEDGLDLVDYNS